MKRTFLITVAAAWAVGAAAQTPPSPAPAATESASEEDAALEDEIVVLAEPGDQVRIDRRTYTVRNDPVAQSTNMFDVLARIPSVSVAPSGAVTLLGAANVTVQINGQPVQGDLEQVLRGLNGADVERIEVITNPSAAFSAQSSGGIINIVTRGRFNAGLSGSAQAGADTLENQYAGLSASWAQDAWSLSGQASTWRGEDIRQLERTRTPTIGDAIFENGVRLFNYDGAYGRFEAGYRFDERRRLTGSVTGVRFDAERDQTTLSSDATGPLRTLTVVGPNSYDSAQYTLDYQQDGLQPREQLKLNATYSDQLNLFDSAIASIPAGGGGATAYSTTSSLDRRDLALKADVVRPFSEERLLSFGAAFEASDQDIRNGLTALTAGAPPSYDVYLDGRQETTALYGTYQFVTGAWTWLPGVRLENYRRELVSGPLETDDNDFRAFPTIHVRRDLAESLVLDLSYSSRIQHPELRLLDPGTRFFDVDRAFAGNPNLEPTTTDAFEANLTYQRRQTSLSLTLYDRISDDIVSQRTDLTPQGVFLTQPVNAGTSEQRGAQVLFRGPLSERWRYSLSGNVLNRAFDVLQGGAIVRRNEIEYDGVAQIEYRDADQSAVGADHLQFEVRFRGPRFELQSESDDFISLNATWRRRLTPSIFGVLSIYDAFDTGSSQNSVITTEDYVETTEFRGDAPRIRLAITYQFGANGERTMQEQPTGPSGPMQ